MKLVAMRECVCERVRTTELRENAEHVGDVGAAGGAGADVRVRADVDLVGEDDAPGSDAGGAEAVAAGVECAHGALGCGLEADAADVPAVTQDLFLFVEQGLALVEERAVLREEQFDFELYLFALEVEGVEVVDRGLGLLQRARLVDEVVTVDLLVEGVAPAVEVELLLADVALVAADACGFVEHRVFDEDVLTLGEELKLELVAFALHDGLVSLFGVLVRGEAEGGPGVGGAGRVEFGHAGGVGCAFRNDLHVLL